MKALLGGARARAGVGFAVAVVVVFRVGVAQVSAQRTGANLGHRAFAILFASFFLGSVFACYRWSHPFSLTRRIAAAQYILGFVVSGVCLLATKSATPEDNRKRLWGFFWFITLTQIIVDVLR